MEQPKAPSHLPPSKRTLTLQSIPDIDNGRVAIALNQAIRIGTLDVLDRPADKSARKIHLIIELRPVLDKQTAVLEVIDTEFIVKKVLPVQRSAPYPMHATVDGQQIFDVGSPKDPSQNTFTFRKESVDEATGEVVDEDDIPEQGTM